MTLNWINVTGEDIGKKINRYLKHDINKYLRGTDVRGEKGEIFRMITGFLVCTFR